MNQPRRAGPDCVIGLMAGTSLDGVDAAAVVWPEGNDPDVLAAETIPYSDALRARVRSLGGDSSLRDVAHLDGQLGDVFAHAAEGIIRAAGIARARIRAIASHGQTVWHAPAAAYPTSIQLGDPNRIAEITGLDVVADFRRRDMAAGGQGAPLAPLFHQALFHAVEDRAVLNLGGIAHVTLLTEDGRVSGFDTGPANTLLDAWCRHHDRGHYDAGGDWASQGTVDEGLLAALLADDFFSQPPPRSTGPEHFNMAWLTEIVGTRTLAPVDVQATLSELSARSAADAIQQQLPGARHVIVCGGGVHNADLMRRLRRHLHPIPVSPSNEHGINPDWIEAIGFAWLGRETVAGRPGNAQAVTGARHQAILGGLYRGS